jgi:NAD(P)-dependent dehydrogenase (short-subunit alcohol dehydrogenase family)
MVAAAGECGNFRLAVNAAGMGEGAPLVDELLTTWERVHSIVLAGTFLSVKHEAREMIKSGLGGAIINVASINANIPTWSSSAYSSAKAGVEMLTKSAALELARYGVRVNCVSPGLVETPMARRTGNLEPAMLERWLQHTPLGRVGNTDDIASAILFLGGDQSMWVTGHNLVVDGGLSLTAGPVTEDLLS